MLETLSIIGTIVLIVIGVLIIVLLAYAIRLLILIYGFFGSKTKQEGGKMVEGTGSITRFITGASVVEIILFLLKNRGRFKR